MARLQWPWQQRVPHPILIFAAAKKNGPPAAGVQQRLPRPILIFAAAKKNGPPAAQSWGAGGDRMPRRRHNPKSKAAGVAPCPRHNEIPPQRHSSATKSCRKDLLPQRHSSERLPSRVLTRRDDYHRGEQGGEGRRRRACPPPDTGRGRGPSAASYRSAMTQMTMGGAGVSVANGVPPAPGLPPCEPASSPGITPYNSLI